MTTRLFLCTSTRTLDLATKVGPFGIRANCIAPENTSALSAQVLGVGCRSGGVAKPSNQHP